MRLTVAEPFTALSVPPVQVDTAAPFTSKGAGSWSSTFKAPTSTSGLVWFATWMVSVAFWPDTTVVGAKVLRTEAASPHAPPGPAAPRNAVAILRWLAG